MAAIRPLRTLLLALVLAPAAASAAPPAASGPATKAPAPAPKRRAAAPTAKVAPPAAPRKAPPGQSVGSPTEGHLVGGARITESPYLRVVPVYAPGDVRWGLEALVGMIDRAARLVRKQFPDAVLSVGHLSKPGGGSVDRHASHESGRDADVGFYVKNHVGKPVYADHFVPFTADGTAPTWPGAKFDDARNWALVAAMLGDGRARITHIFVATPLRARLLAHAQKIGAPPALRARAAEVMVQPHGALPHDDHFHVRIACPAHMAKCVELPTARRRTRGHAATASKGHAPARAHGQAAKAPSPARPAAPSKPAAPAKPAEKAAPEEAPEAREAEASKTESLVPNLAPIVPGLDSVVIPAPLEGLKDKDKEAPPPEPKPEPIDDPDGVLDK